MDDRKVIVVGASAGGVEALIRLCGLLPQDLPAAVFIVLHTAPNAPGLLPKILSRHSTLPAVFPEDGEPIQPGKIYIAPPDFHLLVHPETIELSSGPRENLLRPAVDTLFRSAARAFGARVIGIVLSGTRNDGTAGLQEIHKYRGITIVQDPNEALFSGMPESVLQHLKVDYVLPVDKIAAIIVRLTHEFANRERFRKDMSTEIQKANQYIQQEKNDFESAVDQSQQTILTCPECGGVLWEIQDGQVSRYQCHVGHSYSEGSLFFGKTKALEDALWVAVRSLEERASYSRRLAHRAKESGKDRVFERFQEQAEEAENAADVVRAVIIRGKVINSENEQTMLDV